MGPTMKLDIYNRLDFKPEDFIGECVSVLGRRGGGKTNTAARLYEALHSHMPATIVDIDGDYWGLRKQLPNIILAGMLPRADLMLDIEKAPALANYSLNKGVSVILDFDGYDNDGVRDEEWVADYLHTYCLALWRAMSRKRTPYMVMVEEAHEFVPQTGGHAKLKRLMRKMALRGRKRGLSMLFTSQRFANVSKDVLSQSGILFLHHATIPNDQEVYAGLLGRKVSEIQKLMKGMANGSGQNYGLLVFDQKKLVTTQMRLRETYHSGFTPGFNTPDIIKLPVDLNSHDWLQGLKGELGKALVWQSFDELIKENDRVFADNKRLRALLKVEPEAGAHLKIVPVLPTDKELAAMQMAELETELRAALQNSPRYHGKILAALAKFSGTLSTGLLAEKAGLSLSTVKKNPPIRNLITPGYINRFGQPGSRSYGFNWAKLVGKYNLLDSEAMRSTIIRVSA